MKNKKPMASMFPEIAFEHKKAGRPTLPDTSKRNKKVVFYLNGYEELQLEKLKISLLNHSPALSLNDFFRKVIFHYDDTLLDFLDLSPIDEVKNHLKTKRAYGSIFDLEKQK
ncbi:MAG: hypothetical protein WC667_13205 [Sulfurimonas sp.]|jgi:hypothetical protein